MDTMVCFSIFSESQQILTFGKNGKHKFVIAVEIAYKKALVLNILTDVHDYGKDSFLKKRNSVGLFTYIKCETIKQLLFWGNIGQFYSIKAKSLLF